MCTREYINFCVPFSVSFIHFLFSNYPKSFIKTTPIAANWERSLFISISSKQRICNTEPANKNATCIMFVCVYCVSPLYRHYFSANSFRHKCHACWVGLVCVYIVINIVWSGKTSKVIFDSKSVIRLISWYHHSFRWNIHLWVLFKMMFNQYKNNIYSCGVDRVMFVSFVSLAPNCRYNTVAVSSIVAIVFTFFSHASTTKHSKICIQL